MVIPTITGAEVPTTTTQGRPIDNEAFQDATMQLYLWCSPPVFSFAMTHLLNAPSQDIVFICNAIIEYCRKGVLPSQQMSENGKKVLNQILNMFDNSKEVKVLEFKNALYREVIAGYNNHNI